MDRFSILSGTYSEQFHSTVSIDITKPVSIQLNRKRIYPRLSAPGSDLAHLQAIVDQNMSLRVSFGWSFESVTMLDRVVRDSLREIAPKFNRSVGNLISDMSGDWVGFIPFNMHESSVYYGMDMQGVIGFNNELIEFQNNIVKAITQHKVFMQHSIVRNNSYRFGFFKALRKDPHALATAFTYYVNAEKETSLVPYVYRDMLEEQIGCHYLHNPDIWFELLEFSLLKGDVR